MLTHAQGAGSGTRQGTVNVTHSFQFDFGDTVARELLTIEASIQNPVLLETGLFQEVAVVGGTGPAVTLSTSPGGSELGAPAMGAANTLIARTARLLTSQTKLYGRVTGGPTAGRAHVLITATGLNRDKVTK